MAQENEKDELRIEDRRHFDRDGNPIQREESQEPRVTEQPAQASESQESSATSVSSESIPKIDFSSLVFIYVQTAFMHLGEMPESENDQAVLNLDAARQMIDIIELLQEKTRGNLSSQEEQFVEKVLFDLRMLYVQKLKQSK